MNDAIGYFLEIVMCIMLIMLGCGAFLTAIDFSISKKWKEIFKRGGRDE